MIFQCLIAPGCGDFPEEHEATQGLRDFNIDQVGRGEIRLSPCADSNPQALFTAVVAVPELEELL